MGLSKETHKKLKLIAQGKSTSLAKEASQRLCNYTRELIDRYYADYTPELYIRTRNMYNSYESFLKNDLISYGGVKIPGASMHEYPGIKDDPIKPWDFMSTYIYNQAGTWHGGNYHGGYGKPANFSFYNELHTYHEKLKEEYRKRCNI